MGPRSAGARSSIPVPPRVYQALAEESGPFAPYMAVVRAIENESLYDFREAADCLQQGRAYVDPALPRALAVAADVGVQLSVRERQVLSLLAKGLTNREIAEQLFIATSTARDYVSVLINKFQAGNRVEVAAKAVELGYSSELPAR